VTGKVAKRLKLVSDGHPSSRKAMHRAFEVSDHDLKPDVAAARRSDLVDPQPCPAEVERR